MSEQARCDRRIQLFCIPFAGGSRAAFRELEKGILDSVEVIRLEYPGHESRRKEPYCKDIFELVDDVWRQIQEFRDKDVPYAVLGYSMGSIVAYEMLMKLTEARKYEEMPSYAFLCASAAPSNYIPRVDFSSMSEEEVVAELIAMGGIDERITKDARFLKMFLQPVEADYRILDEYSFQSGRALPAVDCAVFYSKEDTECEQVLGWKSLIDGSIEYYEFGHGHFFIYHEYEKMAQIINEKMRARI